MASIDCCRATGRGSHRLASATSSVGFDDTTKPSRGAPPSAPSLLRLASHIQTPYFDHIRHILDNSARSVLLTRPLGGSGAQQVVVGWEHLRTREFSPVPAGCWGSARRQSSPSHKHGRGPKPRCQTVSTLLRPNHLSAAARRQNAGASSVQGMKKYQRHVMAAGEQYPRVRLAPSAGLVGAV